MADDKKTDDGKGMPAGSEHKTIEPKPADSRLIPGGSFRAAARHSGMTAVEHYTELPVMKADLPDLSNTPGWHMMPKDDRK